MTTTSPRGVVGLTVGVAMQASPELRALSERADDFDTPQMWRPLTGEERAGVMTHHVGARPVSLAPQVSPVSPADRPSVPCRCLHAALVRTIRPGLEIASLALSTRK